MWPFADVSLETATLWGEAANIALLICLLGGVLATFVIVRTANVKEHHWDMLREQARIETGKTQGEAARANEAAGKAHERAAALEAEAEKARAELRKANADIAKANAAIATANERTAEAQRKTAEIERQTAEMREKLANRRITAGQHVILNNALSAQKATVDFVMMGDPEFILYAVDVIKVFENAGWIIGEKTQPLDEHWIGLVLYQSDDPATAAIARALTSAEVPFLWANAPKKERATVIIGGRPAFF